MPRLRVHNFAISLDGYGAAPRQSLDHPLGVGGTRLHEWVFSTKAARRMFGEEGGAGGIDNDFILQGDEGIGATIMGRNMFGPIRGPWEDDEWRGWWGNEPPYHHPVFVLTHHPHPPIPMEGGTVFNFVTDGIESALEQAVAAAGGADVRLGGGVSTIQQYLKAGLVDDMHVAIVPVLLGDGERLFEGVGELPGFECVGLVASEKVVHARFARV
jgi:dihydrofolate reductase